MCYITLVLSDKKKRNDESKNENDVLRQVASFSVSDAEKVSKNDFLTFHLDFANATGERTHPSK